MALHICVAETVGAIPPLKPFRDGDEHPPTVVSSDAALMALQEDVVKLEKSIVQLKQLKQEAQKQQV